MKINNSKGFTLAVALSMVFLFGAMGIGALEYSENQGQYSFVQKDSAQAFWLAEAGVTPARTALQAQITVNLQAGINNANANTLKGLLPAYTPLQLLFTYDPYCPVINATCTTQNSNGFQQEGSGASLTAVLPAVTPSVPLTLNQGSFSATVTVEPEPASALSLQGISSNPTMKDGVYTFYYEYFITSTGNAATSTGANIGPPRSVTVGPGYFSVTVQLQNFAQYGVFTSNQTTASGVPVWFTSNTVFTGPLSTNTYFNFEGALSSTGLAGTFNGVVTQVNQTAQYFNQGTPYFVNDIQDPGIWCQSPITSTVVNGTPTATSYTTFDEVQYNSVYYYALQNSNCTNNMQEPDKKPTYWKTTPYYPIDVPQFNAGFFRGQTPVNLNFNLATNAVTQTSLASSAWGGTPPSTLANGVYLPNSGGALVGGIFVKGNANSIALSVSNNNPIYTITQGTTVSTITVNYATGKTSCVGCVGITTIPLNGSPNGVGPTGQPYGTLIYVTGQISNQIGNPVPYTQGMSCPAPITNNGTTGLSGEVQTKTQLTISAVGNIQITNNITYEDNPLTDPNAQNILGLISWTGNIEVSAVAPNNLAIDGILIAPQGEALSVDYYYELPPGAGSAVPPRGTIYLLGGIIGEYYGGVGGSNLCSPASGYGRNFTYDTRVSSGMAPLFFPYTGQFTSTTGGTSGSSSTNWNAALPWSEGT